MSRPRSMALEGDAVDGVMVASRFYRVGAPLQIESVPIPSYGDDGVLVRIMAAGICGSDIHIVFEGVTPTALNRKRTGRHASPSGSSSGSDSDTSRPVLVRTRTRPRSRYRPARASRPSTPTTSPPGAGDVAGGGRHGTNDRQVTDLDRVPPTDSWPSRRGR
jgi:hypothetical protein